MKRTWLTGWKWPSTIVRTADSSRNSERMFSSTINVLQVWSSKAPSTKLADIDEDGNTMTRAFGTPPNITNTPQIFHQNSLQLFQNIQSQHWRTGEGIVSDLDMFYQHEGEWPKCFAFTSPSRTTNLNRTRRWYWRPPWSGLGFQLSCMRRIWQTIAWRQRYLQDMLRLVSGAQERLDTVKKSGKAIGEGVKAFLFDGLCNNCRVLESISFEYERLFISDVTVIVHFRLVIMDMGMVLHI